MRVTIKDVAREAGVSIKTVSRVLNNERYVGAETRDRVLAVVERLNFRPSAAARSLAGGKSLQIALICDNPSPYYVYEMQLGVRDRCVRQGVRMLSQPYDRASPSLLGDIDALISAAHVDGLILTPPVSDHDALLDRLRERGTPFVRVSPGTCADGSDAVFIDNERAAAEMAEHLLALGHRRIGMIAGHPGYATSAQRTRGFLGALARAGITPEPGLLRTGTFDFASGAAETAALLALPAPPSAIFAASDDMAAGALATAHRLGVKVPEQLSIAGFDDTALAPVVWPALTTIRQPVRELGYAAADLLFAATPGGERRQIAHSLIVRESTGPARG